MTCEQSRENFNNIFGEIQAILKSELDAIATDTETKAKQISDDFEADHDLAEGIGAIAGTAVGGYFGGPAGAVAGEVIGRTIGSLFTLEVGMQRQTVSLDVPQTTMEMRDFSFDMPTVVVRDTDISFDVPTIEMRTERGPDIPEITVRMEQQCVNVGLGNWCTDVPVTVVTMKPTYLDVPVTVMKTQRIVVGVPQVEMRRQEMKLDVPNISMKTMEFSADIPYVTLRFVQDAGKRTAALAAALAQSAQDAAAQKQVAYKQRLRSEVAPLAVEMFACFRGQIVEGRSVVLAQFSGQIQTLQNAVTAIAAKGVPDDSAELKNAKDALDAVIQKQNEALKPLDEALAKLDESTKASLAQLMGDAEPKRLAKGGLGRFTPTRTVAAGALGLITYASKAPAKGLFLSIGLNSIDPAAYGDPGTLFACESDARDMASLATIKGYTGRTLLTSEATAASVLGEISRAASTLSAGDIFLVTYSGHGGQVGDITGDEADALDETWCLYDRQLVDDELYAMWSKFKSGVRILVLSDSCHSGTVTRANLRELHYRALGNAMKSETRAFGEAYKALDVRQETGRVKALPFDITWQMYLNHKPIYDSVQLLAGPKEKSKSEIGASLILISGCQDNQLSLDGTKNGVFTEAVKHVWNNGSFNGNYKSFRDAIINRPMPPSQTPNYYLAGATNLTFEAQKPFTL